MIYPVDSAIQLLNNSGLDYKTDSASNQPRPQGLLAFQYGGGSEDPGTQQITCLQRLQRGWRCIQNGQPRPQGLLLVQNGGRRNPWPRLLKYSKNRGVFCHVTHEEMGRFPFNQNFRKFRSETEWNGSDLPEIFRKRRSTFRGGPLFSVGPF